MRQRYVLGFVLTVGAVLPVGCATSDEHLGVVDDRLTKCQEPTPGDGNFCSDPNCKCTLGEGDCDSAAECVTGLTCSGKAIYFGFASNFNVCAAPHCNNKKLDGDETQTDCGGSCGTFCPPPDCSGLPANGVKGHCTVDCRCAPLEGGCTADSQCQTGSVCTLGHGVQYGYAPAVGVCTANTCSNGMQDGAETGIDCGGSCKPCPSTYMKGASFGGGAADRIMDFTYDASGNLIIVGRFGQTINFGTTPATAMTTAGGSDIFVAKFDPVGTHLWSRRFGGPNNDGDGAVVVAVDAGSGIFVGGNVYSGANFGSGPITTNGAASDAFVMKITGTTGVTAWAKTYGGPRADRVSAIAIGPTGAVFIAGSYSDTINLGGATYTAASATLQNKFDMFVAKLSSASGGHSWSRSFGGVGDDQVTDIAVDSTNSPLLVGNFSGAVTFGPVSLTSNGTQDGVVLKLGSGSGGPLWGRALGGPSDNDGLSGIAIGPNGNPVITGYYVGTANLGAGNVTAKGTDMFVSALNNDTGAAQWVRTGGGEGTDRGLGIATDSVTNDVVVTGSTAGSPNFGTGALPASPGGAVDLFVARYAAATGAPVWALVYGGASNEDASCASIFDGVIGIGGRFQGAQSFGGSVLPNGGNFDAFLLRYKL